MLSRDSQLIEYSDGYITVMIPSHHKLTRSVLTSAFGTELTYASLINPFSTTGTTEIVEIVVRYSEHEAAKSLRHLLLTVPPAHLVPPELSNEKLTVGSNTFIENCIERISVQKDKLLYEIWAILQREAYDVGFRILANGEYAPWASTWQSVIGSFRFNESFSLARAAEHARQDKSRDVNSLATRSTVNVVPEFVSLLSTLPSSIGFLRPAIVAIEHQGVLEAEEADLDPLIAVITKRLRGKDDNQKTLQRWNQKYDQWYRHSTMNENRFASLAIVHGALLGFALYGLPE